jgi:hypothetical protein
MGTTLSVAARLSAVMLLLIPIQIIIFVAAPPPQTVEVFISSFEQLAAWTFEPRPVVYIQQCDSHFDLSGIGCAPVY